MRENVSIFPLGYFRKREEFGEEIVRQRLLVLAIAPFVFYSFFFSFFERKKSHSAELRVV